MRLKEDGSVRLEGLQPQMVLAALIVHTIFEQWGYECIITSGSDGKHKGSANRPSRHYSGNGLDFRIRHVVKENRPALVKDLSEALGPDFDVVLHATHVHVEYDPKEGV
jgi:hypothetical protein